MRLNQAIAQTGICSRRKADELIAAAKIKVNGRVCTDFSTEIDPRKDTLEVSGRRVSFKKPVYIAIHKPSGIVTSMADEKRRKTVVDLLPKELRHVKPVGRLDMYSEGLLILTNDGDLALSLTHPSKHVPKLYEITLKGFVTDESIGQLKHGVELDDGPTLPCKIAILKRNDALTCLRITLTEGRNRQIRRMFAYVGHPVERLVRTAIGGLQLGKMAAGTWRYLTSQEVAALKSQSTV